MKEIMCLGSACKDIFFPTAEGKVLATPDDLTSQKKLAFEMGAKYKIDDRYESIGGCAANVSIGLAKLGVPSQCYAYLGDDVIADWITAELNRNRVSTQLLTTVNDCVSGLSAIIVDIKSGDRVIFSNQESSEKLEVDYAKLSETQWLFIGDIHGVWEAHLDTVIRAVKEQNIRIAFNPRQSNIHDNVKKIIELLPLTEVLVVNKDEALEIVCGMDKGCTPEQLNDEKFLLQELKNIGSSVVVITDGVRGAWVFDGQNGYFSPGKKVNALDSTGAGDSFVSAFLAAYLKEQSIDTGLRWGIANSSHEVQFYGSVDGLLTEAEIIDAIKTIDVKQITF